MKHESLDTTWLKEPHSSILTSLHLRHSSFSNPSAALPTYSSLYSPSVASPTSYSLHLRHNSFSKPSAALPTSQLILQPFRFFTYVIGTSPTSTGVPPMPLWWYLIYPWWFCNLKCLRPAGLYERCKVTLELKRLKTPGLVWYAGRQTYHCSIRNPCPETHGLGAVEPGSLRTNGVTICSDSFWCLNTKLCNPLAVCELW